MRPVGLLRLHTTVWLGMTLIVLTLVVSLLLLSLPVRAAGENAVYLPVIISTSDTSSPPGGPGVSFGECQLNTEEQALITLMAAAPEQRRQTFTCDPELATLARARAEDMARRGYDGSTDPDGMGLNNLTRQAGFLLPETYDDQGASNDIGAWAVGFTSAEEAWNYLANSTEHNGQVLGTTTFHQEQTRYGVGYFFLPNSPQQHYWVIITLPTQAQAACLSPEELELADLINNLRRQNGLSDAPLSASMTLVARTHAQDLQIHRPDSGTDNRGLSCNLHSWSDQGNWTPVCYTSDHEYADLMWNKPREVTQGVYTSSGYEISYRSSSATAQGAFSAWRGSSSHNAVMIEEGIWRGNNWQAMGIGIQGQYAVVWFGEPADPQGQAPVCTTRGEAVPAPPTATPTQTPTPSATPDPAASPTPSATASPTATPSATPTETETPPPPPPGSGLSVNTQNRQDVVNFYQNYYSADQVGDSTHYTEASWTGSHNSCNAGTTSQAFRDKVQQRINFFRAMAGVPGDITFSAAYNAKAQEAALMMSVESALSHSPSQSWSCYSADGAEGAGASNLSLGTIGIHSIDGQMQDAGRNNNQAGHRWWILFPRTKQMGTGSVPPSSSSWYFSDSGWPASALWVQDASISGEFVRQPRDGFVAWPPQGFVPYQLVFPRWSFGVYNPNAPGFDTYKTTNVDFSGATVTMTSGGQNVPLQVVYQENGFFRHLVWVPLGLDADDFRTEWPQPTSDTTYTVTINNVQVDGQTRNYTYDVTVFDPGS